MTEPHDLTISHVEPEFPGFRRQEPGQPTDVNIGYLREVLESAEGNLTLTDAALRAPDAATRDLAKAVRGAILSLDKIAFHLLELHRGIADGALNYTEDPQHGYPRGD